MADRKTVLEARGIRKSYRSGDGLLVVLKGIDLRVLEGESVSIVGKSGSGKSTLLNILALLGKADGGTVLYDGKDVSSLTGKDIEGLRRDSLGFVFQNSLLFEDFSALENVMMPLLIQGKKKDEAKKTAMSYLEKVGLENRGTHRPKELSGGEAQRVALARALSGGARIIFADEPTGSLDEESRKVMEKLLLETLKEEGRTLILITHDPELAGKTERRLVLEGGILEER